MRNILLIIIVFMNISAFAQFYVGFEFGYANPLYNIKKQGSIDQSVAFEANDFELDFTTNDTPPKMTLIQKNKFNIGEGVFFQSNIGYYTGHRFAYGIRICLQNNKLLSFDSFNNSKTDVYVFADDVGEKYSYNYDYSHFYVSTKFTPYIEYNYRIFDQVEVAAHVGVSINIAKVFIENEVTYNGDSEINKKRIKYYVYDNSLFFQIPMGMTFYYKVASNLSFYLNCETRIRDFITFHNYIYDKYEYYENEDRIINEDKNVIREKYSFYNITTINTSIGIRYYFGKKKEEAVE